jgi:hypothetical protein
MRDAGFDVSFRDCPAKGGTGGHPTYDWSSVYSITSVDDAVPSLNTIVQNVMDQAIARGFIINSKFPHWFSSALLYYIWKKRILLQMF